MSVHLVGGGALTAADASLYAPFVAEAAARARVAGRNRPRVAVISIHPEGGERAAVLVDVLAAAGEFDPHVTAVRGGEDVAITALAEVDGIAVGGGIVEEVRAGLEPVFGELRRQVAAGVPYLGVSAGAMIAAEGSLSSGSRIDGVVVAPEDVDEPGFELEIEAGIGLVDVAIEVHVAQRGMLSRLVAAVESGLVDGGLGIDERTALIVGEGGLRVEGLGSVWRVLPADGGVLVSTIGV
ncbi:Type 1 glutamine amidotransferase-like domain-containing protein [Agromyces sp. SYSU K20354]|uniref:Type 1 glutamine amidotransferase-like domain-containing protein n=1 Tax=Agromyces cavernae TaxID=2898659 RepID=UPI001E32C6B2|nr:Type 1 glutamine amidotransferase-like domain-containing protein [Agromyces cavernae]MCD2443975.1 Type 1 glutamine amidotransferase-like domain-containing protein [Agromyces cavernae]